MGHVTILDQDVEKAISTAKKVAKTLRVITQ
jgi:hypothetical protein